MSKTSKPDRQQRRGDRRREPSEFSETTLSVDRVTRVVKGGRRMRFRAIVIVGNKKGKVGLGTGKANEVQTAVQKATKDAKRNMVTIPLKKGTIVHEIEQKFKSARIRLLPASEGTGIIAGGAVRVVLEHAGIKDVLGKRMGTRNHLVNAQATMRALSRFVGKKGGTPMAEEKEAAKDADAKEKPAVRTVSKKDVSREGTLKEKKA